MPEEPINNSKPRMERVGKYEIVDHIATGGMGIVYKARDVDLDRIVALKVLSEKYANDPKALTRFRREAKASAQLRHDNIVAIFDVGEDNGTHFLALEYIEGTDLQNYIDRKCRLEPEEARQIIIQATRALMHAHQHKIVHRDIKPSNLLMTIKEKKLVVKLTDFGLAIRSDNDAEFRVTRDGTTVGTVDYMSPEQARDSKAVDIRSDIYSLGCTFFHMLAGSAPFAQGTLPERLIKHMQAEPPDMRRLNQSIPDSLIVIVNRMLEKSPDDRYQTPDELLSALVNHERVAVALKAGRGPARKVDPTIVIENRELAKESVVEPKPAKSPRPKKEPSEAIEEKRTRPPRPKKESPAPSAETDEVDSKASKETRFGEDIPEKKSPKKGGKKPQPLWIYAAGGSLGVLVLVLFMAIGFGRPRPPKKEEPDKPDPPPIVIVEKKPDPPVVIDTPPDKMTVGPLPWPAMDAAPASMSPETLRKEYAGPFQSFLELPPAVRTLQLRRLGPTGATGFRTLADALAQADPEGWTVIEIHDDGPIYLSSLPALAKRSIVLRGAAGHRPLLAWEPPRAPAKGKQPAVLFSLTQGKLVLENLDLVVRWPDEQPLTLFDLSDADFHARDCTFSLAGMARPAITLVQQSTSDNKRERAPGTWLQRCYVRGADVTLLGVQQTSASLFVEESLVVGQNQPLIDLRGREEDAFSLHSIRSTFVTGQVMLRWQAASGKAGKPVVNGFLLDSIVSRNDPAAALGDLVHLADKAEPTRMSWKSANCVYAGWKKLLASADKDIAGDDIRGWRRQWSQPDGDRAVVEPWPSNPLSRLEEATPHTFLPAASPPIDYAAWTGIGAVGCVIGRLPADPESWSERTFDPPPPPNFPAAVDVPPEINAASDGFYHGEKIDLNMIPDLGFYLTDVLKKVKPAPRVVLHLSGKGNREMSSLRVKGIGQLVLYFAPSTDVKSPLILEISRTSIAQRVPLIEMIGGSLEMIGARIQLSPISIVPTVIHVQGGDLTLTRCVLQGPLAKSTDSFKSLIWVDNPVLPSPVGEVRGPATVLLRNNVLMSGKLLLHLQDNVQLRARNNLLLSLGDGMHYDGAAPASARLLYHLDHNTWAVRHTIFTVRTGPGFQRSVPILMHANSNAFLHPFADDTDKTVLWRGLEPLVWRTQWIWQGRHNVYDGRANAWFGPGAKQTLKDWQQAWGSIGEVDPLLLEAGPMVKTITVDAGSPAAFMQQLDRLVLPRQLRGDPAQAPPGADLFLLGILKKKV